MNYLTKDRGRRLILFKFSTFNTQHSVITIYLIYGPLTITSMKVRGFPEEYKFDLYMHWINIENIILLTKQTLSNNTSFVLYVTPLFRNVLNHSRSTFKKFLWLREVPPPIYFELFSFKVFLILLTTKYNTSPTYYLK